MPTSTRRTCFMVLPPSRTDKRKTSGVHLLPPRATTDERWTIVHEVSLPAAESFDGRQGQDDAVNAAKAGYCREAQVPGAHLATTQRVDPTSSRCSCTRPHIAPYRSCHPVRPAETTWDVLSDSRCKGP